MKRKTPARLKLELCSREEQERSAIGGFEFISKATMRNPGGVSHGVLPADVFG